MGKSTLLNSLVEEEVAIEEVQEESNYVTPSYDSANGQEIVDFAEQYLGYSYVYGGTSPETGFDCSGFTYFVMNSVGIDVARDIYSQEDAGEEVAFEDMQPGDLIIFTDSGMTGPGHTGIYIGDDEFIHAANPSKGVRTDSVYSSYYNPRIITIRRLD